MILSAILVGTSAILVSAARTNDTTSSVCQEDVVVATSWNYADGMSEDGMKISHYSCGKKYSSNHNLTTIDHANAPPSCNWWYQEFDQDLNDCVMDPAAVIVPSLLVSLASVALASCFLCCFLCCRLGFLFSFLFVLEVFISICTCSWGNLSNFFQEIFDEINNVLVRIGILNNDGAV